MRIPESPYQEKVEASAPLFTRRNLRPIVLCFTVAFFSQLSGVNAVNYYAPRIFGMIFGEGSELVSLAGTIGVGVVSVDSTNHWCLYSAKNVNHHVKATKVNLGEGVYPFCISTYTTKKGDKLLNVLAAQFDPTDRKVVNSVWESRDGVSFKKLFTFKTDQQASAIARTDAGFFVGIGWRFTTRWNLACKDGASGNAGDDVSGSIYKIP